MARLPRLPSKTLKKLAYWVRDDDLVPLFPIPTFVPQSYCPHHGPLARGGHLCCMVCHKSGQDHRPAFQRNPRTDPKPDPKPEAEKPKLSAKERRYLLRQYAKAADKKTREFLVGIGS